MCIIYFTIIKVIFMNFDDFTKPTLTEPGIKYFLNETLKQCKDYKEKFYNSLFNFSLLAAFCLVLAGILYYKYQGKPTPVEIERKNNQKKQFVMSKIKNFLDAKRLAHQELITGLPGWDSEYDVITTRYKV